MMLILRVVWNSVLSSSMINVNRTVYRVVENNMQKFWSFSFLVSNLHILVITYACCYWNYICLLLLSFKLFTIFLSRRIVCLLASSSNNSGRSYTFWNIRPIRDSQSFFFKRTHNFKFLIWELTRKHTKIFHVKVEGSGMVPCAKIRWNRVVRYAVKRRSTLQ